MSLKKFEMPASVIAELYEKSLIQPVKINEKPASAIAEPVRETPRFLGGNAKRITIIVAEKDHAFLDDNDLNWLQKMLQACKLTLGDVAIVNIHKQSYTITAIRDQLQSEKIILLGTSPSQLEMALNFPQFKLQEHDACVYLCAPSPGELNQETAQSKLFKSKLWVCLQKLFGL